MMVDDDIDYERENRISQEYYRKGYFEGSTKATSDLVNYLVNLSDEKLLELVNYLVNLSDEKLLE